MLVKVALPRPILIHKRIRFNGSIHLVRIIEEGLWDSGSYICRQKGWKNSSDGELSKRSVYGWDFSSLIDECYDNCGEDGVKLQGDGGGKGGRHDGNL